eukprot:6759921-Prymnesium_polylepis.1
MSAEELWALKMDTGFEQYLAVCDGKRFELISEEQVGDMLTRTVKLCFPGDEKPVPLALRRVLSPDDVVPIVTSTWHKTMYDEEHPCKIHVTMPTLGDRIAISGVQWLVREGDANCTVVNRIQVAVRMFGVGRMVENQIEQEYQQAYDAFPERRAVSYWRDAKARPSSERSHTSIARRRRQTTANDLWPPIRASTKPRDRACKQSERAIAAGRRCRASRCKVTAKVSTGVQENRSLPKVASPWTARSPSCARAHRFCQKNHE